jgi:hypothetical protein
MSRSDRPEIVCEQVHAALGPVFTAGGELQDTLPVRSGSLLGSDADFGVARRLR